MAFGSGTISSIGSAVNDLFSADAHRSRATGLRIQSQNYDLASDYADKNADFTRLSTSIKQSQLDREIFKTIGGQTADVAGAGFANSGSAIDIMRDSASQGALMKAVGAEQGLITEEGYKVQAESFSNMGRAATLAAQSEDDAADRAPFLATVHAASAVASVFGAPSIGGGTPGGSSIGDPTQIGSLY